MTGQVYDPDAQSVAPAARPVDRLVHWLLPALCLGCGRPLPVSGSTLGLCEGCRGRLRPLSGAAGTCPTCARPLPGRAAGSAGRQAACGRCLAAPPACERLLALWRYEPPLDAVIAALKFRRLDYLGGHLAAAASAALAGELAAAELAVPIPLHWRRLLARGYNQAERIARPLAGRLGIPCIAALRRPRATPPQTSLGRRERLANVRGVFQVRRPGAVAGRRVLLVDDVATTGATLEAAARALRAAGAAAVVGLVAGRTPEPADERAG